MIQSAYVKAVKEVLSKIFVRNIVAVG